MKRFGSVCVLVAAAMSVLPGITAGKPRMIPPEEEILIQKGDQLVIQCKGEGELQFSAEWNLAHFGQSEHHVSFNNDSGWYTFTRPNATEVDTGWYACAEEGIEILNDEQRTDHPEKNISWIYVYVNSSYPFVIRRSFVHGPISIPMVEGRSVVIPCRPTSPNLSVTLEVEDGTRVLKKSSYDPKLGFIIPYGQLSGRETFDCQLKNPASLSSLRFSLLKKVVKPTIVYDPVFPAVRGQNLTLKCHVPSPATGKRFTPRWKIPGSVSKRRVTYDTVTVPGYGSDLWPNWYLATTTMTIYNVERTDADEYICAVKHLPNGKPRTAKVQVPIAEPGVMRTERDVGAAYLNESVRIYCDADGYPLSNSAWVKIGGPEIEYLSGRIENSWENKGYTSRMYLDIRNVIHEDNGTYECRANDYSGAVISNRVSLLVFEKPVVKIYSAKAIGSESVFLNWTIYDGNAAVYAQSIRQMKNGTKQWRDTSEEFTASNSSYVINGLDKSTAYRFRITATNVYGTSSPAASKWVTTLDEDPQFVTNNRIIRVSDTSITIEWSVQPAEHRDLVHYYNVEVTNGNDTRKFTHPAAELNTRTFEDLETGKTYSIVVAVCSDYTKRCGSYSSGLETVVMDKDPKFVPNILHAETTLNSIKMSWSMPPAESRGSVYQYKVLAKSSMGENGPFYVKNTDNSYLFEDLVPETGYRLEVAACSEYETQCGNWSSVKETLTTVEKGEGGGGLVAIWIAVFIVTILLFSTMFVWMRIRKRSELAARRRFIQATIERFKIGDRDSLDPELEMAAQAELLPYNEKWEFPRKFLKLDKVLGSGAFGTVKKAVATSICKGEKYTTVAVKMVRANHRLDHMTALQRELKILAHLGKHVNVVNLLGACTGNISYGELFVIVEFCRFGNLHDFLLRRRDNFVDQVDVAGPSSGTDCVITIDNGMETASPDGNSASEECSRSSANSEDASELEMANDPAPGNDSVEPVQMSNYEGDFADSDVDPIGTWDLLCWAWQISRGMKYLASKRVVHGDLATRNILLAERNVVKICDFGLAKTLYAGDVYKKSGTGPLPIKWMAVESIRDRLFSVKSDVWAFGVVLWELFSLAETPYPGIANDSVYQSLVDGFRMERPKYATKYIHSVMRICWVADPAERPSFGELEDLIDDLLDESMKEGYLHFDAMYAKMNEESLANGDEDVLAMSPAQYASRDTVESTV